MSLISVHSNSRKYKYSPAVAVSVSVSLYIFLYLQVLATFCQSSCVLLSTDSQLNIFEQLYAIWVQPQQNIFSGSSLAPTPPPSPSLPLPTEFDSLFTAWENVCAGLNRLSGWPTSPIRYDSWVAPRKKKENSNADENWQSKQVFKCFPQCALRS